MYTVEYAPAAIWQSALTDDNNNIDWLVYFSRSDVDVEMLAACGMDEQAPEQK